MLQPLVELRKIRSLFLRRNRIEDITPLTKLPKSTHVLGVELNQKDTLHGGEVPIQNIDSINPDKTIPDVNLAAAVRKALSLSPKDTISQEKLTELKELSAIGKGIRDLTGIEKMTRLNDLKTY